MRGAETAIGTGAAAASSRPGARADTAGGASAGHAAWDERAVVIPGSQGPMIGVLAQPSGSCRAAVLIVAGQPQTRVGAHRMFTELARGLAERGVASLRFDVGGWGDSPGEPLAFEESASDIAAAAAFLRDSISPAPPLWLWGLCDGASAAVLALPALRDAGVAPHGLCLVNPWVRSEASLAAAMVKTYYAKRLMQREFWMRLLTGRIPIANLVHEPLRHLRARFGLGRRGGGGGGSGSSGSSSGSSDSSDSTKGSGNGASQAAEQAQGGTSARAAQRAADARSDRTGTQPESADLPEQLLVQLAAFRGEVLTVLSGNDLTAGETEALMSRDKRWRKRLDRKAALLRVPGADHTFSDPAHWQAVIQWCAARAHGRIRTSE